MAIKLNSKEMINVIINVNNIDTGFNNGNEVFSSGKLVTYIVDTGKQYQELVRKGQTCLSPTTFTPTKIGWTFVGWREDSVASSSVLSSKVMGNTPVTLYAVFKAAVTLTMYNDTQPDKISLNRLYNNGNIVNPTYKVTQLAMSGWTTEGWSTSTVGDGGITYANGATITVDRNITIYGRYNQSVTLTYWDGNQTLKETRTRCYNRSGSHWNPTIAIWQVGISGWNHIGFSTSSAANGAITHQNGAIITMDGNKTFYARYNRTLTCRFDGGGATGGSTATASGVQDRGANGAVTSVQITIPNCEYYRTNYSFGGWSYGGQTLQSGSVITITESTYATATWTKLSWSWGQTNPGRYVITIPYTADYVISCYGARGGNFNPHGFLGGFGGWAQGTVTLSAGTIIYVYVGGAGTDCEWDAGNYHYNGGYNGGGAKQTGTASAPGGGATHVATVDGLLQNLSGNKNQILIVAGGGGGAGDAKPSGNYNPQGGGGGGTNGSHGYGGEHINADSHQGGQGGTQTEGGNNGEVGRRGIFGKGADTDGINGGAGGGGWYGGGRGGNFNGGSGGGGGSGYIGGVRGGQMKNDVQNGNGKIDIWIP